MRIVTRIRYKGDRSEPILFGSRTVEVLLRPDGTVVRWVKTGKPVATFRSRTRRASKVAARRWLAKAGASLGYEVRKKL